MSVYKASVITAQETASRCFPETGSVDVESREACEEQGKRSSSHTAGVVVGMASDKSLPCLALGWIALGEHHGGAFIS